MKLSTNEELQRCFLKSCSKNKQYSREPIILDSDAHGRVTVDVFDVGDRVNLRGRRERVESASKLTKSNFLTYSFLY